MPPVAPGRPDAIIIRGTRRSFKDIAGHRATFKSIFRLFDRPENILCYFAQVLNIPLRTVESWCTGVRKCPDYVVELIAYKLVGEGIIKDPE